MEAPIPVVITRSTWLRGDRRRSKLYNPELGKMCCVGFMCLAKGISKQKMDNIGGVHDLWNRQDLNSDLFWALYALNDVQAGQAPSEGHESINFEGSGSYRPLRSVKDVPMTDAVREAEIIRLAAPLGFAVTFED